MIEKRIICGQQINGKNMSLSTATAASGLKDGADTSSSDPTRRLSGAESEKIRCGESPTVFTKAVGGGGSWTVHRMPEGWCINYRDLTFRLRPMGFKHTGLFPEQAVNWDWQDEVIRGAISEGREKPKVLNLFAYTGGATVACAKAGAALVHVDASKGMTQAAKENMALSGLEDAPCRYIVDDCKKFVEREIRRGNKYDGIIMDPPSYGRGPGGEVWKLEECAGGAYLAYRKTAQ